MRSAFLFSFSSCTAWFSLALILMPRSCCLTSSSSVVNSVFASFKPSMVIDASLPSKATLSSCILSSFTSELSFSLVLPVRKPKSLLDWSSSLASFSSRSAAIKADSFSAIWSWSSFSLRKNSSRSSFSSTMLGVLDRSPALDSDLPGVSVRPISCRREGVPGLGVVASALPAVWFPAFTRAAHLSFGTDSPLLQSWISPSRLVI